MANLLIYNIGLLATPIGNKANSGPKQDEITFIENAYIYIEDKIIKEVGKGQGPDADAKLDAKGKLVTPGLVDSHSHLVFGGNRANELKMKLEGKSYLEILESGGGILSTVKATNNASFEELYQKAYKDLDEMLSYGTTTLEAKSGYGLSFEQELKQLEVVKELNKNHPIDLVSTFMGGHALPVEYKDNREIFIDEVCEKMIPYISENRLAEFCDVFCEKGVFDVEETRKILQTGQKYNLKSKIHADEIEAIGGSQLAGELNAISAEHLIVCDEKGMEAMSKSGTIACLLPCTSLYLGADFAKAKAMIEHNIPIALASDYNPGSCPSLNMQLVMNLACLKYRMSPNQVLNAVTLNGAAAIDKADKIGTIETGKQADIIIWDTNDFNYIFYRLGSNLVDKVIKKGRILIDNEKTC